MAVCAACGQENKEGRKFCASCGSPLARPCPTCGAANDADDRFCGECGAPLGVNTGAAATDTAPTPLPSAPTAPRPAPVAERRLVSVLFADLVGFTTLSERRDAEEVRELLSRYFESARQVIGRYGGTVEKFIGDAVMAVWGTPVSREDDAERAVRAALELVQAVAALGGEIGARDLRLRAGVVTGEAAVTLGAEGQGMVAGDLVNTASRVQSVAAPGTVLVGERTRRASEAAVAYEEAGEHELKGKAERVPLWRALRVLAARRGEGRSQGLEAPFVGRDGELRLLKELFHATAEERRARLVSVVGIAGIGKSRLGWEFEKYLDGLLEDIWWHRGRCLAYGEGVAYWALAEMIRMRAGIAENEEAASALAKLRAVTAEIVPDPEERAWVEPRLAHLLALEERTAPDREDLFSAWRHFFERMAEQGPLILLFEDLQWGDTSLLDFVEYLLEWARGFPIYVVTLARPELLERRPDWGAGTRNSASLYLEPLAADAMEKLVRGLVPGLPDELRTRIRERSEGIPLYAVETVRMLLDRGLLAREGNEYRPTGMVEALEVPETLHALIAARLDGLPAEERRLLEDASVLGKTFRKDALAALSGIDERELDDVLSSLVRKEILSLQRDPRSPERGQYGFLQALVQKVAHDTLSRRERKARHLAAARYFHESWADEEEIVEVIAAHYLAAYEAAPEADDAPEIRGRAAVLLARAGERAASLAAVDEAQRYFEQALELAEGPLERARLHERAGEMARAAGRSDEAERHLTRAIDLFEDEGELRGAARSSALLGVVLGATEAAFERLEKSFAVLSEEEPSPELALLAARLATSEVLAGKLESARGRIELALAVAESLALPEVLSEALNTKSIVLSMSGRWVEASGVMRLALEVALENDLGGASLRAYFNLAHILTERERHEEAARLLREALALARRRGDRFWERPLVAQLAHPLYAQGDWDEVVAHLADLRTADGPVYDLLGFTVPVARIQTNRARLDELRVFLELLSDFEESTEVQARLAYALGRAILARAEGRPDEALAAAEQVFRERGGIYLRDGDEAFLEAAESAFVLGDLSTVRRLLSELQAIAPGALTQFLQAHGGRFAARLAAREGNTAEGERRARQAVALFRELAMPFWLAVSLVEHSERLGEEGRADEAIPLLLEAREIFGRLGALPWLDGVDRAEAAAGGREAEPGATVIS